MYKILGLLLMGSVIAFLGDRIGTRIGKKRLSILGMRPRKTAVLMTMVTGMVITLTTLYITSLLNPNIKAALFDDIESIKKSNQELENRYQDLQSKKSGLETKVLDLIDDMEMLENEKVRLSKRQQETAAAIEQLKTEKTELNDQLSKRLVESQNLENQLQLQVEQTDNLKKNIESLESERERLQLRQEEMLAEQADYKKMMDRLTKDKEGLVTQLNEALNEKISLKEAKAKLEQNIANELKEKKARQETLGRLENDLELTRKIKQRLEQSVEEGLDQVRLKEERLGDLKTELTKLDEQVVALTGEVSKAQETIASLQQVIQGKKQKQLVLNSMEPLLERPLRLEGPVTIEQFALLFEKMLERINQSMSKQGVRFELGNSAQKRQIMQGVYNQASDIWRNIEDSNLYIEKPSRGVLVYPVSANNLVKGEPLRDVNFLVSENKLLILKGKEIARAVLDSSLSAEELLGQMFEMDEQLKKQMFDQGILGNRFKPRAPGQIMRFAQVVSSIKNEKDRQFISVIADADIYSGGGFAFRYDIKKEVDYLRFIEQRKLEDKSPQQRLRDRLKKFKKKFQTSISESTELTMP